MYLMGKSGELLKNPVIKLKLCSYNHTTTHTYIKAMFFNLAKACLIHQIITILTYMYGTNGRLQIKLIYFLI